METFLSREQILSDVPDREEMYPTLDGPYSLDSMDSETDEDEGIDCTNEKCSQNTSSDTSDSSTGSPEHESLSFSQSDGGTPNRCLSDSGVPGLSVSALHCLDCDGRDDRSPCLDHEFDGFEEYMYEMFYYRLDNQRKYHPSYCLQNQLEVSPEKRQVLVRWLTVVHHELKLGQDTLFLAVNLLDRVFDDMQVAADCLEILALTCLLVASKQNEVCPPEIQELQAKCPDEFSREQVKQLEVIVLMVTGFDLIVPTMQQFLEYYASFCLKYCNGNERHVYKIKLARGFARCLLEMSLQDYQLTQFLPSLIALCVWNATLDHLQAGGHFFLVGMDYPKIQYDVCLIRVRQFIDDHSNEWPDMTSVFETYPNIHSTK